MIKYFDNTMDFEEEIKEGFVIIDFFADWCGPCKMLNPILEELDNNIKILKVNVDINHELTKKFGILSIPTILIYNNKELVKKHVGFISKAELENFIEKYR